MASRLWQGFAVAACACALAACGGGRVLAPEEGPDPGFQGGAFALLGDFNRRMTLTFCQDADFIHCVDVGPLDPNRAIAVAAVAAGRWCLMTLIAEASNGGTAMVEHFDAGKALCFQVPAHSIAYPGHMRFQVKPTQTMVVNVDYAWLAQDNAEAQLRAAYPNLADWPVRTVPLRRKGR